MRFAAEIMLIFIMWIKAVAEAYERVFSHIIRNKTNGSPDERSVIKK